MQGGLDASCFCIRSTAASRALDMSGAAASGGEIGSQKTRVCEKAKLGNALPQPDQLLLLIRARALLRIQQRPLMARPMCSICHSAYTAECELQARAPLPASLACAANGPSLHRLCRSAGTCFTARACLLGFAAAWARGLHATPQRAVRSAGCGFLLCPQDLVLTVAYSLIRPSFQRARCCGCALTFQQPVNWQRNSKL